MKDNYIRFNWAIKYLLCLEANFGVLEGFLSVLLNEKVEIIGLQQIESRRVDVKAKNSQEEIVLVEIQNMHEIHYFERLYANTNAIAECVSQKEFCYGVKKMYSVNILYFNVGRGDDYLYHGQDIFTGVHTGNRLNIASRSIDAIIRQLPVEVSPEYYLIRVYDYDQVAATPLDEWVEFLKSGYIRPDTTVPGLVEAREKFRFDRISYEDRHAYDEYQSVIMIQNDVLECARLEGRIQGRLEVSVKGQIAANMKNLGIEIPLISQATGLTPEQIEKL
ncbi:hypothetical protein [Parabacteroides sp.]